MTQLTVQTTRMYAPQAGIFGRIAAAFGVADQRHRLAKLDDCALADMGLSRSEAVRESRRPLWDLPKTNKC